MKILLLILVLATSLQADELLDVTWTLYEEAKGEPYRGIYAVASVIYTRSIERDLTLSSVCRQRGQFSCWNSGREPRRYTNGEWSQCEQIALSMTQRAFRPLSDWNHFFNPKKSRPYWARKLKNKKRIGNHIFGRLN